MSVADLHDLELIWPSLHPTVVVVTGTFDQWSSSIHLVKGDSGFFGTVKVPWDQKVAYKFIVDGRWQCRNDRPQEDDGKGNINNVLRTPEKPQVVSQVAVHDPPSRLSIPPEGAQNGDVETMVTAIEYFLPVESTEVRGPLPLTIPHIVVESLGPAPSADTPVSVSKLDTATATEGTVPPASKIPGELAPFSSAISTFPVNDNNSVSLPPVDGNGEAHNLYSFATPPPIQLTKGEPHTSPLVPETVQEGASTPLMSTATQSNRSPQDASALVDRADTLALKPVAVLESTPKQPEGDRQTVVQSQRQKTTVPASISDASSPSIPASSTLIPKKRRSLFARIKHVFGKDKEKGERK